MTILIFLIFFAFNFSLWFLLPTLLLKSIIKKGRKKKDKTINKYYIVFSFFSILYSIGYTLFYRYFKIAIDSSYNSNTIINYFSKDINILFVIVLLFLIVALLQGIITFILMIKLFKIGSNNKAYSIIMVSGFLNIVSYFVSNTIMNLNLYSFEKEEFVLNILFKLDYQFLLFIFPILVFSAVILSFFKNRY